MLNPMIVQMPLPALVVTGALLALFGKRI